MQTKNYKDVYSTKQTGIVAKELPTFTKKSATILVCMVGQKFLQFWFAFWEKRWPHKFILNLTDLYLEDFRQKITIIWMIFLDDFVDDLFEQFFEG